MELVRRLGLRYFWFDSLCLVQDDPEDLRKGILAMDIFYEGPFVTIIAANSDGAEGGLPGVRNPRRSRQNIVQVNPGVELILLTPLVSKRRSGRLEVERIDDNS